MNRSHTVFPPILTGYDIGADLGIIVPKDTVNLITNPSFETGVATWQSNFSALARSATRQYFGAYSCEVTPSGAGVPDVWFPGLSFVAGLAYTFSVYLWAPAGVQYQIYLSDNANTPLSTAKTFTSTGKWQRVSFTVEEQAGSTTRRAHIGRVSDTSVILFYLDGAQVEQHTFATTYCDGDQPGLIDNPAAPAYLWDGTPHASTSRRSAMTRAGGRVRTLAELGLVITSIVGLGLPTPNNANLPYGLLDGALYQRSTTPPRQFSVIGRIDGFTAQDVDRKRASLEEVVRYDAVTPAQPVILVYHTPAGEERRIEAVYQSGLEGKRDNLYAEQLPITFTAYMPYITGGGSFGMALTPWQTIVGVDMLRRSPAGVWSDMATGPDNTVLAIAAGLDGKIYAGGSFANAGGVAASRIAMYDPIAGTWAALGSGLDDSCLALAVGPDGKVYAGGKFLNAGGVAANRVAVWNGSVWATVGAGAGGGFNGQVNALAFTKNGTLYAGGAFTTANGATMNMLAYLSSGTWTAVGTGLAGGGTTVYGLAADTINQDRMYLGGVFTTGNGVTLNYVGSTTGTTFAAMAGGAGAAVHALVVDGNGLVYVEGSFTTIGGVSANRVAVWNGTSWAALGAGLSADPSGLSCLALDPGGSLWIAGAGTSAITPSNYVTRWSGSGYYPPDLRGYTPVSNNGILFTPDGSLYLTNVGAFDDQAGVTVVTNYGQADAYPVVTIVGPGQFYELTNYTTGQALYFNGLMLQVGETVKIDLTPGHKTITSSWRGNLAGYLLPGSDLATWRLATGANNVSLFVDNASATASLSFVPRYRSISR